MIKDIVAIDVYSHINHGSRFDSNPNRKYYINKCIKIICNFF